MIVKNVSSFPVVIDEKEGQKIILPNKEAKVNGKNKHVQKLLKLGYIQKVKEEKDG